jgi:large subunit ribosomal protein L7Ae
MAEYTKFNVSPELEKTQTEFLGKILKKGKIRIGANEATKAIERQTAKIIFIAQDVNPPEIVMHLPILCREKKIPYSYFKTKEELGKASGIKISTAAIAVTDEGDAKKELETLQKKTSELNKGEK